MIESIMQFISDNRAWIMLIILIIAGLGLMGVIDDIFKTMKRDLSDMTEEWHMFRERLQKLRKKL